MTRETESCTNHVKYNLLDINKEQVPCLKFIVSALLVTVVEESAK